MSDEPVIVLQLKEDLLPAVYEEEGVVVVVEVVVRGIV
jgi:hypothetical protein